jgi:hypothetical protein
LASFEQVALLEHEQYHRVMIITRVGREPRPKTLSTRLKNTSRQRRKIWGALAVWFFSLAGTFLPQTTAAAVNFNYDTTVNYRVNESGTTDVRETYTVTNNTQRQYLAGIKLLTPTDSISSLVVKYSDGTSIPATTSKHNRSTGGFSYNYQEINITFPRQIYGQAKTWDFFVSYSATGLVDSKGSAHTIYVPSIDPGDSADSYTATIDVPASFGNPHFSGARAASGGVTSGRQYYTFSKTDLVTQSLVLAFGDQTTYNLNFNFPLVNDSPLPHRFTVTLPPDLNNQKVVINSLQPQPTATRLDEDGNILADYMLKPHQRLQVKTNVSGIVSYLEYDLSASGKKTAIPSNLVAKYTRGTQYWQTNGAVAEQARKITDPHAPVINNVKAVYKDVIEKLSYNDDKIKFNIRQGSSKALANPTNVVCLEYADLMIAMLRSVGIPARMPIGYAFSGNLKSSSAVDDSLHSWVEAYVPGIGWITIDPTWGEKFDGFGKSDLDHFAFAVWGEQDGLPASVMSRGTDLNYQYEQAVLTYQSKPTVVSNTGKVEAKRYAVLPFLSIDRVHYNAEAKVASDNNSIRIGGLGFSLGSLAPLQRGELTHFVLGPNWNKSEPVKFTRAGAGQTLILASADTRLNYTGFILLSGLILIVVVGFIVVRLRSRKQ